MSFEAVLHKMVDDCAGAIGIALMGRDGIPVAEANGPAAEPESGETIAAAGVEFGRILEEIAKASDALDGGRVSETLIGLERFWLLFRAVDDDLFLVVALGADGNLGKARFRVRRYLSDLLAEL